MLTKILSYDENMLGILRKVLMPIHGSSYAGVDDRDGDTRVQKAC